MITEEIKKHIKRFKDECRKAEKANKRTIKYYIKRKCTGTKANVLPKLTGRVGKYKKGLTQITSSVKEVRRAISHWENILKRESK